MKNDTCQTKTSDDLFKAILQLENIGQAQAFFSDLLTPVEISEFSRRWQVAKLLWQNTPYTEIEKQTNTSSTTIARVSKFLSGRFGGYRLILNQLNQNSHHPSQYTFGSGDSG